MRYLILITLIFTSIFALADQVTIYNNNLALVRTNIELPLNKGVQDVLYDGITSGIQPQSVIVRPSNRLLLFCHKIMNTTWQIRRQLSKIHRQRDIGKHRRCLIYRHPAILRQPDNRPFGKHHPKTHHGKCR